MHLHSRKLINKQFTSFFISQTILGCGGFIQTIAVASLLVKITNSGVITGFSIVCAPLPGIIFSLFAGSLGDRFSSKKLLVFFDFTRGILTLLFLFCNSAVSIFILTLVLNSFDVFYNPSKNKLLTSIIEKDDLITGNAVLKGGYGIISIITPVVTGFTIAKYGVRNAFIFDSLAYILSAVFLLRIKADYIITDTAKSGNIKEISNGLKYCFNFPQLKNAIITVAVMEFGSICVNIAYYAFAFDTLKVTSRFWGLLLSVIYGMNFFSMLLLLLFKKRLVKKPLSMVNILLIVIALVWYFYSKTNNLLYLLGAGAVEGLCLSLCNTMLITYELNTAKKEYTARVMSIQDVFSSTAKLFGVFTSYIFMGFCSPKFIFVLSGAVYLLYTVCRVLNSAKLSRVKT